MALLDNFNQQQYYEGNLHGQYQFISLRDIITQFEIAYVGENKIIPKIKKTDILFHAQRALQELSFDTVTSFKSHELTVPPSLVLALPYDYVNYTKISSVDNSGIKHIIYPTKYTSNPFDVRTTPDGEIFFTADDEEVVNGTFEDVDANGVQLAVKPLSSTYKGIGGNNNVNFPTNSRPLSDKMQLPWKNFEPNSSNFVNFSAIRFIPNDLANINTFNFPANFHTVDVTSTNSIGFEHCTRTTNAMPNHKHSSFVMSIWQELDVSDKTVVDLSADGLAQEINANPTGSALSGNLFPGTLRVGLTTINPENSANFSNSTRVNADAMTDYVDPLKTFDLIDNQGNLAYVDWATTDTNSSGAGSPTNLITKQVNGVDVSNVSTIYVVVYSFHETMYGNAAQHFGFRPSQIVDNISVLSSLPPTDIQENPENFGLSETWNKYKAHKPSENNINDYQDYENDLYWPNQGERYGIDPEHAQVNGSYYIDQLRGNIHFSSVLSGRSIIIDYISDGLGTEDEMKVHKFAEEAMYKHIAYAILSTSTYGQALVPRFKKEKFAETRKAKLRLSNFKLEELAQILRGKSKQIKH